MQEVWRRWLLQDRRNLLSQGEERARLAPGFQPKRLSGLLLSSLEVQEKEKFRKDKLEGFLPNILKKKEGPGHHLGHFAGRLE